MIDTTWILVANASKAKIYTSHNLGKDLSLYDHPLEHMASRAKRLELNADKAGHYQKQSGSIHGAFSETSDVKKVEAEKFAIELAHKLYNAYTHQKYDRLLMIANFSASTFLTSDVSENAP